MSKRQRLLAYYLLARSAVAREEYGEAISWLDEADGLATELLEVGALAELARLRAATCQELQRFAEAADASWDYLVLLRDPRVGFEPGDVTAEIETRLRVAQAEFFQEHYDLALVALADADALIRGRQQFDGPRLHIAWIRALLHRWRGESSIALPIAMEVAEAPSIRSSPQVCGRIETIVADLSMDRAETFAGDPASYIRASCLTIAGKYLRSSEMALLASPDIGGAAMARLARVRFSRMTGANEDRLAAIASLERLGRTIADDSLVIQALTARGEELLAQHEREPALAAFRQAVDLARQSQVAAMGARARRALLLDQELRD
jgi:tetratricopeptide (TPR) repeat protein